MAEFCLECFNKINGYELTERDVKLTTDRYFCEECSTMQRVVIKLHPAPPFLRRAQLK